MTPERAKSINGLDETVLDQLIALGVLRKACQLYLENSRSLIDEGRAAVQNGHLDEVARVFHTLTSSSAMVGAIELSKLCKRMETIARDGKINECREFLIELLDSHQRAITNLRSYLNKS